MPLWREAANERVGGSPPIKTSVQGFARS